jgi:cellulose synthase/poly-beta-1,6-N-acetylglucosamine synthase-like glycosyltransferase
MIASPGMPGIAGALLDGAGLVVVALFVLLNSWTAVLLIRAMPELWRHWDLADEPELAPVLVSEALPTVSVVVTGTAEWATTVESLRSLLALRYPRHEVVLVHDGVASGDLPALIQAFDLYQVPPAVLVNVPTGIVRGYYRSRRHGKLFVIDKEHGARADDLNAALNASRFPYILTTDVHTWLEPDALSRLMRPFLLGQHVAAVAGTARIAQRRSPRDQRPGGERVPTALLPGVQAVQRLREGVFARLGWNTLGGQLPTDGAVLLQRRDHLLGIDGYRTGPIDEELDLVVRLRRHLRTQHLPDAIPVVPDVIAWTNARESARAFLRQRVRVHRGELEALLTDRRTVSGARRGMTRLLAPAHLAATALLAPAMELVAYLLLVAGLATRGTSDPFLPLFALAVPGYAILLTLWAVALEATSARRFDSWRDLVRLSLFAVLEQVGFRQLILWSRLRAAWSGVRGGHSGERGRIAAPAPSDDALSVADQTS